MLLSVSRDKACLIYGVLYRRRIRESIDLGAW